MAVYDGNGLCGVDSTRPLSTEQERAIRDYFILFQQAVIGWGTNMFSNSRGEHNCKGSHLSKFEVDSGVANAYLINIDLPSIRAINEGLYAGLVLMFLAANTNTGASTLEVIPDGAPTLGPVSIKWRGIDLPAGSIHAGDVVTVVFDGTDFNFVGFTSAAATSHRVSSTAIVNTTGTIPFDNTIPQLTEGGEFLQVSITPSRVGAEIEVRARIHLGAKSAPNQVTLALFKGGNDAFSVSHHKQQDDTESPFLVEVVGRFTATSTDPITVSVRGGTDTGQTLYMNADKNGDGMYGAILVSELEALEV